ncbi:methyltransferase domain-containing protein [candidate division KSB1 bacterium]|nr:methyltransferase domain-containing protein [candidate division KSB1 bacterium]
MQTKEKIRHYFDYAVPTLDLGCGTAEFCRCFAPGAYLGIDIFAQYITFAKKRRPGYAFVVASGQDLCLQSKSFSQILISGVIHHLNDEIARHLLKEAHRVLVDDGKLLLIEDITASSTSFLSRLIHAMDMGDHIREKEEYERLINKLFKIDESFTYYSGYCHYGLWLMRKLKES